ncbi:hypothetical protein ACCO45_004175 [Purpureocillium lilacinum]|uniref:Uncharacterized protein n=1 Tax=Purpureocillium lilacinum TaxID=33203 RepID=A0ACC4E2Y8_PURLI
MLERPRAGSRGRDLTIRIESVSARLRPGRLERSARFHLYTCTEWTVNVNTPDRGQSHEPQERHDLQESQESCAASLARLNVQCGIVTLLSLMPRAGSAGDDEAAARCNPATPSGMLFDRTRSPDGTWPACNSSKCQNRRFPSAGRTAKHATRPITGGCDSQVPPARQAENPRMGHGVRAMEMETGGMGDRVPVKPTSATPLTPLPLVARCLAVEMLGSHAHLPFSPTDRVGDPATRQLSSPGRPLPGQPTGHSAANSGQLISNDPIWQPCPRDVAE